MGGVLTWHGKLGIYMSRKKWDFPFPLWVNFQCKLWEIILSQRNGISPDLEVTVPIELQQSTLFICYQTIRWHWQQNVFELLMLRKIAINILNWLQLKLVCIGSFTLVQNRIHLHAIFSSESPIELYSAGECRVSEFGSFLSKTKWISSKVLGVRFFFFLQLLFLW